MIVQLNKQEQEIEQESGNENLAQHFFKDSGFSRLSKTESESFKGFGLRLETKTSLGFGFGAGFGQV